MTALPDDAGKREDGGAARLDETAFEIAAQCFANYFNGGDYDALNPPSPDPLRQAVKAYLKYAKRSP